MASTFSTDLKLELMTTGEKSGLWGDITNTNLTILQQAIAGFEAISIAGGAQTTALTFSNGLISNGKNAVIKFTGTITGNQVVTIPDGIEKTYIIENGTTGAHTVEFKTVSGTGPTFSTTNKGFKVLYSDGTNIVDVELSSVNPTIEKIFDTNGNEEIIFTATGSAVNELTIANAATTAAPTISTTGSDTNIDLRLATKGTGGVVFNAGAVATPSITTTGDTNTGIFFPSADTIAFTEGGVERMRINSDGNVVINTLNTGAAGLNINNERNISFSEGSGASIANLYRQANSGALVLADGYKYTTTANGFASSFGSSFAKTAIGLGVIGGAITFYTDTAATVANGTDVTPTERMRITSVGNVSINCTAVPDDPNAGDKGAFFASDGFFAVGRNVDGASVIAQFFGRTGQVNFDGDGDLKNTNNSYGGISDRALKENETNANSQWNDIKALQIKNYNFIGFPNKKQIGVIAQDLEASGMNGLVKEMKDYKEIEVPVLDDNGNPVLNEDGTPQVTKERIELDTTTKSVKYSILYMKAVKALQEAMERIETLEAKVTALENK